MRDVVTVTVDTNVLLDVFQVREPYYEMSDRVVNLVVLGSLVGVCPSHGLTTLYYLIRKRAPRSEAEAAMDRVIHYFRIGNLDTTGWQTARKLPITDFEDAAVAAVAKTTGSTFLITRNVGDFAFSPVLAVTPASFLGMTGLSA